MNSSLCGTNVIKAAARQLAKLDAAHGYRFETDNVHLNAMFNVVDLGAHQRNWALQLWACQTAPTRTAGIRGHLIAEIALPPISELAVDTECFEASSFASTPAGQAEHIMVLALVAGAGGRFTETHDFAIYPRREQFLQPRIVGNAAYRIDGNRVKLEVERIENPRDEADTSGTLSLELWALPESYSGGNFQGVALAGVTIDPLSGMFEYGARSFDLPFTPPPAGTWNLTLMLREWTAAGFQTRDYTNFAQPLIIAAPEAPAKVAKLQKAAPAAATVAARPRQSEAKPKAAEITTSPGDGAISINTATKVDLTAIKGLPGKVADEIIARRPFKSLEELAEVKGVGVRLLEKLRAKMKV